MPFKFDINIGDILSVSDPEFVEALSYRDTVPNDGNFRDIYDGSLYKSNKDFFRSKFDLSLVWHTDGVEVSLTVFGERELICLNNKFL